MAEIKVDPDQLTADGNAIAQIGDRVAPIGQTLRTRSSSSRSRRFRERFRKAGRAVRLPWPESDPAALDAAARACSTAEHALGDEASRLRSQANVRSGWHDANHPEVSIDASPSFDDDRPVLVALVFFWKPAEPPPAAKSHANKPAT